jgi:hypothetical protein
MDKTQIDWVVRPLYPTPEMIMAGARTKYVAEDGFKNEVGDVALQVWLNMGNAAPTPAAIPGELQAQAGMGDELPPLPEQLDWVNVFDRDGHTDEAEASSNYYDTDQMEAYARAALAARQQGAAAEAVRLTPFNPLNAADNTKSGVRVPTNENGTDLESPSRSGNSPEETPGVRACSIADFLPHAYEVVRSDGHVSMLRLEGDYETRAHTLSRQTAFWEQIGGTVTALYTHPAPATDCAALVEAVRNVIGNLVALAAYVRGYMPGEVRRGFAVEMNQQADMLRAALAGVQAGKDGAV